MVLLKHRFLRYLFGFVLLLTLSAICRQQGLDPFRTQIQTRIDDATDSANNNVFDTGQNYHEGSSGQNNDKHPERISDDLVYYTSPSNNSLRGTRFSTGSFIKDQGAFVHLDHFDMESFVFVTASSTNHFKPSNMSVASLQHHFPNKKIIYYDLGLKEGEVEAVKSWCNVEYRRFPFENYPAHVKDDLHNCAFKAILEYEVLMEHEALFYIDASVSLTEEMAQVNWKSIYKQAKSNGGMVLFWNTGFSCLGFTAPGLYDYIPTDVSRLEKHGQCAAGIALIYHTRFVHENIMHWYYSCSLEPLCISPYNHSRGACAGKNPLLKDLYCHRYDQSALNIIMVNAHNYTMERYLYNGASKAFWRKTNIDFDPPRICHA